ncbi:MAG: hypothetical protein M9962_14520 [Oligoflexia bacterium]|nr:hypothetical protein [Oligoflexia bacterium]
MKQGSIKITRILTLLTLLLFGCGASNLAFADADFPPPDYEDGSEVPLDPLPPENLPNDDTSLPPPSIGDSDPFPDPMSTPPERNANQKNINPDDDDIFLPTPVDANNTYSAPVILPYDNRVYVQRDDWYSITRNRPVFSLSGGVASRNYPTTAIPDRVTGYNVGVSYRFFDLGQTVFLHAYAGLSFFSLGDVNGFPDVRDTTLHYGPMLEVGIGRRLSLFGTFLRRSNSIETGVNRGGANPPLSALRGIGEEAIWKLGVGAQFDFYVIPHGSLGLRAQIEQDVYQVVLTMAIEPRPRERLDLNFENSTH